MLLRVLAEVITPPHQAVGAGDHLIKPRSDQAEDDGRDQAVRDVIRVLPFAPGFPGRHETTHEDADDNHDAVPVDGYADERQSEGYGVHVLTFASAVMSSAIVAGYRAVCNQMGLRIRDQLAPRSIKGISCSLDPAPTNANRVDFS